MYSPRLVFYPASPDDIHKDNPGLAEALSNIGLIQTRLHGEEYLPGDSFLDLLTFLGCAPDIHLSPEDGDAYCYIKFNPHYQQAHCLGYVQTFSPSCAGCKSKLKQWYEYTRWQDGTAQLDCPHCGHSRTLQDIKWRREAAYGRCGFYIANIHPHEALPSDKLMDTLQQLSGFKWAYAYANNQEMS